MRKLRKRPPQGDNNIITFYGLQEDEVAAYLLSVKVAFEDDKKLIKLTKLLKAYKAQKIAADDLAREATILFEHHPKLLLAFNAFLPETEKIAVDVFLQPFEKECLEYITKLEKSSPHLQKSFLKIMNDYGQGRMSLNYLKRMVFALPFKDRELISEFDALISCEDYRNGDTSSLDNPTRKVKRTKCDFSELVFNKEISFFEKAKAKMQQKKKSLNALFTCFDKYRQARIVSCEFQKEVERNLCPALAKEARKLFVHDHPSYSMLRQEEKCNKYESNLARKVLNNDCGLFDYDSTIAQAQIDEQLELKNTKKRETQERSQDQGLEQKSEQDITSLQDEYEAEKHRNKRTLKTISKLERRIEKGSSVDFDTLLKGFCFTSVKKCCGEDEIRMLRRKDQMALSSIKNNIERRQRLLEAGLKKIDKEIDEYKKKERERASQGGKRVRKQVVRWSSH